MLIVIALAVGASTKPANAVGHGGGAVGGHGGGAGHTLAVGRGGFCGYGPGFRGYPGYGYGYGYGYPFAFGLGFGLGAGYGYGGYGYGGYGYGGYGNGGYGYPGYGYPPNGYPPNGYPPNGYPPNGYPPNGAPPEGTPPSPRSGVTAIPATPTNVTRIAATSDVVLCVDAPPDAVVWVNGQRTTQPGSHREFVSSGLIPGRSYTYEVRALWMGPDNRPIEHARAVLVHGGERLTVDFELPPPPMGPLVPVSAPPAR